MRGPAAASSPSSAGCPRYGQPYILTKNEDEERAPPVLFSPTPRPTLRRASTLESVHRARARGAPDLHEEHITPIYFVDLL